MISAPTDRRLPSHLCDEKHTRILMLSFFTKSSATDSFMWKGKELGVKNRLCFAAKRDYKYIVEVIPGDILRIKDIEPMYYKAFLVKHYLRLTDWLVWLDFDLIVKNPSNWYEQYLLEQFELVLTDHINDINNGTLLA